MTAIRQRRAVAAGPSVGAGLAVRINRVVQAQLDRRGKAIGAKDVVLLPTRPHDGAADAVRFSGTAAEAVVRNGLKASALGELAAAAGIDVRHLLEFAGIDRTTVSRRMARDDVLPQEASVKAMQFADLMATAVDVFGTVEGAVTWLTRPHPMLQDETPLQRARTPWGLQRVRSMLGALKYGGAA